jgi:small subunit ribosomal protein S20
MANIKSAQKRARQSVEQRARNASLRTTARSAIKQVKKAVAAGDKAAATAALVKLQATVDRVTAKGVLHRGAADRHKSRLTRSVKAMA